MTGKRSKRKPVEWWAPSPEVIEWLTAALEAAMLRFDAEQHYVTGEDLHAARKRQLLSALVCHLPGDLRERLLDWQSNGPKVKP